MPSNAPGFVRKTHLAQRGFSLIELLVVVAIIGVLAGAGVYAYSQYLDSVSGKASENNLEKISKALNADVIATNNQLSGSSDLTAARTQIAADLSTPEYSIEPESCEAFALSAVKQINASQQNPYKKENPAAAYGNIIQTDDTGRVIGPPGFKLTRGTVIVSCNDPRLPMSDVSNVRLYQCVCTAASDSDCRFSPAGTPYTEDTCPRPPITPTGFAPGSSPVRPIP